MHALKAFKWILLAFIFAEVDGEGSKRSYNVLLAIPVASRSIHNLFSSLAKALVDNGHSVRFLTSYNQSVYHKTLNHFQPEDFSSKLRRLDEPFKPVSPLKMVKWMRDSTSEAVHMFWTNDQVKILYSSRSQFDAIIYTSYINELIMPFLDGFQGVSVLVCTPGVEYYTVSRYGNWLSLAVVPNLVLPYDENMSFLERSYNLFLFYAVDIYFRIYFLPQFLQDMRIFFPDFDGNVPGYYERSSLTLINGHFALDGPVPLLPNQVEIGTINAAKPKPLPKDLEEFMQGSGDAGVIYFSLGSFIQGNEIPPYIKDILLEAFRRVPQRVLWKYEDDDLDLPPNVMTRKWLPQQDILGHPKTKIFMSHCGNLGTQEAKYHGVPVLAVPIAFDQPRNAARLVRKGYGVIVNWKDLTVEKFLEAVDTLTKNPEYIDRMKNISRILQDQKDSPAERAVWWIEYVIRHKGAPHMQYAGQRLSLYQYIMLDVIVFWSLVSFVVLYAVVWSCRKVWRKCCGRTKSKKAKKE